MRETEIIGQHRGKFAAQVKIFLNKPCLEASSCCFCWTWEGCRKTNTKWCFDDWCMVGHIGWLVSPPGLFSQLHKSNDGAKSEAESSRMLKPALACTCGGWGGVGGDEWVIVELPLWQARLQLLSWGISCLSTLIHSVILWNWLSEALDGLLFF